MKNLTTAALLLLSVFILAPQASFAGKPGGKPVPVDCDFIVHDIKTETACTEELFEAHDTLGKFSRAFKSEKDYIGLRCKVAAAQIKTEQNKPLDAFYSLEKSEAKIWTLFYQRKINSYYKINSYDVADILATSLAVAKSCAGAEASK
jgi:hypothetical protein